MTLVRVRELVKQFGGWALVEVGRAPDTAPHLTFFVQQTSPRLVADQLTAAGVTWPKGRVVEWYRDFGRLAGEADGFEVRVQFAIPTVVVTREEV